MQQNYIRAETLTRANARLVDYQATLPLARYGVGAMSPQLTVCDRRRILTQLNRGEGRHKVARTICYGKRGEIRKAYREGQEDQLNALGLVTNAVILWNTLYMQAGLEHLQSEGADIQPDDRARLSPLQHRHLNVLGRYSFALSEPIASGNLRPLNIDEWDEEL